MVSVVSSSPTGGNLIFKDNSDASFVQKMSDLCYLRKPRLTAKMLAHCLPTILSFSTTKAQMIERNKNIEGNAYGVKITGRNVFSYFKKYI